MFNYRSNFENGPELKTKREKNHPSLGEENEEIFKMVEEDLLPCLLHLFTAELNDLKKKNDTDNHRLLNLIKDKDTFESIKPESYSIINEKYKSVLETIQNKINRSKNIENYDVLVKLVEDLKNCRLEDSGIIDGKIVNQMELGGITKIRELWDLFGYLQTDGLNVNSDNWLVIPTEFQKRYTKLFPSASITSYIHTLVCQMGKKFLNVDDEMDLQSKKCEHRLTDNEKLEDDLRVLEPGKEVSNFVIDIKTMEIFDDENIKVYAIPVLMKRHWHLLFLERTNLNSFRILVYDGKQYGSIVIANKVVSFFKTEFSWKCDCVQTRDNFEKQENNVDWS
ncbi:hypothetical protein ACTA71_000088 [Dictyostelium dimigraforme]